MDSSFPLLLGQQVACYFNLSLLETFIVIRLANVKATSIIFSLTSL
jgi:hypothetical protein